MGFGCGQVSLSCERMGRGMLELALACRGVVLCECRLAEMLGACEDAFEHPLGDFGLRESVGKRPFVVHVTQLVHEECDGVFIDTTSVRMSMSSNSLFRSRSCNASIGRRKPCKYVKVAAAS